MRCVIVVLVVMAALGGVNGWAVDDDVDKECLRRIDFAAFVERLLSYPSIGDPEPLDIPRPVNRHQLRGQFQQLGDLLIARRIGVSPRAVAMAVAVRVFYEEMRVAGGEGYDSSVEVGGFQELPTSAQLLGMELALRHRIDGSQGEFDPAELGRVGALLRAPEDEVMQRLRMFPATAAGMTGRTPHLDTLYGVLVHLSQTRLFRRGDEYIAMSPQWLADALRLYAREHRRVQTFWEVIDGFLRESDPLADVVDQASLRAQIELERLRSTP